MCCCRVLCPQLGLSVAVLVMVQYELQGAGVIPVQGMDTYTYTCYMALPEDWPAACIYGELVAIAGPTPAHSAAAWASPMPVHKSYKARRCLQQQKCQDVQNLGSCSI